MQRLHDRMPVILEPENYRNWLEADDPRELLRPAPIEMLQCYPVSTRVNKQTHQQRPGSDCTCPRDP